MHTRAVESLAKHKPSGAHESKQTRNTACCLLQLSMTATKQR